MEKVIKLGGNEVKLHSSLFTIIQYRSVFGSELFSDIKKLETVKQGHEEDFSLIIGTIFKIIYILHRPFTNKSYDEFLMGLDFSVLSNQDELEILTATITTMLGAIGDKSSSPQFK